ncbi:winged helix-turn-helix transcriptional regulator [Amycolatopsis pithecellobii]|uniref:Transcriptional regulator n=1 Tax=Amycolatopsis pithecellobii TaxID=664692 RepID=A0A6N7ZD74_9PSEU|nr:helix-turn-helix domain-containing protein [Amycolatopsis pithecellobii]MTD59587.1 transcriptional regulator [Amycolatopsis pithecellobii]
MASNAKRATQDEPATVLGHCPRFHAAIELIGRRWNGVILQRLLTGPLRFSEIRRGVPGLTDAMLSQRLRELEDAAVVKRIVTDQRPVQVTYALTPIGSQLSPVLTAVADWSVQWAERDERAT